MIFHNKSVFMANLNSKSILNDENSYDSILKDYLIFQDGNFEGNKISKHSFVVDGNLILENDIISPLHYVPEYLEMKDQLNHLKNQLDM